MFGTEPQLLVVDDHDGFRELLALRLRHLGCRCTTVASVPEAIDAIESTWFDAIVSDHHMPGRSGLDLLAYAHRRRPDLSFVLVSSCLDERLRAAALAGGATEALEKGELLESVERIVPRAPALAA
jgi:CheY-like chemotaxis protein